MQSVAPSTSGLAAPAAEEINLDSAPHPRYPLPSKPFHVQPAPKIGTGWAPVLPLDRSGKKVRHWRPANREIRGIAGGRWFARSWLGDKESELASAQAAAAAAVTAPQPPMLPSLFPDSFSASSGPSTVMLPKLPSLSLAAPPTLAPPAPKRRGRPPNNPNSAASSRGVSVDTVGTSTPGVARVPVPKPSNLGTAEVVMDQSQKISAPPA